MKYEILIPALLMIAAGAAIAIRFLRHQFIVPEGFAGLLYKHGKFQAQLPVGRQIRWGRGLSMDLYDLRKTSMAVTGQEVLTADKVGMKASLLVTHQVAEPAKLAHTTQQWFADLHNLAQLALRTVATEMDAETLLTQRQSLSTKLLELVQPKAAELGLSVTAVELRDIMFPADLKRAFAETLKAKQEGQAALERARGESAALRNLANASRVLEGNPALMNLRLMQSVSSAQAAGSTLVLGVPTGLIPLKNGKNAPKADGQGED
jgi:regulator of protease activity HflC (stomatin/prohibitin superfamily)